MSFLPVKLKNGAEEARIFVASQMLSLQDLLVNHPIAFFELTQLCRNPEHELWGDTAEVLKALNLITPDHSVHSSTRNIVLSAVKGEGLAMELGSPIAEPDET